VPDSGRGGSCVLGAPDLPGRTHRLGSWHGDTTITFGMDDAPCDVAGAYDDADSVIRHLADSVGEGTSTFLTPAGALR